MTVEAALRFVYPLVFLSVLATISSAHDAGDKPVDLIWGVRIPMWDGVQLNATVYKPGAMTEPLPVIFTSTPYVSDNYHERAIYFSRHGYVFALVDVRGRGNSEGTFEPFVHDGQDGYHVVEWLAGQPWCNGKVAMWGGSYAGFNQWAALKEFPPHLATIVPAAAAHPGVDFPFFKGIHSPYNMQWLTFTSGVTNNGTLYNDEASFWIGKFTQLYRQHLPFNTLDRVVGNTSTVFQKWLDHPTPDAYWDAMTPTAAEYAQIRVPTLTITGHYDADQSGAMEYYRRHMRYGPKDGCEKHYLIIGPWDHAGTRTPKRDVKGLKFGEASVVDLNELHRAWYDWTMKSGSRPAFLQRRVAYYVTGPGAEAWKYADALEAVSNETRTLYLHSSGGMASDVFSSGTLTAAGPGEEAPDRYTYDPLDTSPAELEQEPDETPLIDQTRVVNLHGRGLLYHTDPFPEAVEATGFLKLVLWIELDVPDTDFLVTVYEILPDGSSVKLASDDLRARYRESLTEERLVTPGAVERYVFDAFTFFSRRISKGSRLRLVVTCPNTINQQKNYNSGGVVAAESAKDARTAHVIVHHDVKHPSALEIPVVTQGNETSQSVAGS